MVIFKRIRKPKGGIISGGENPVIPFPTRDRKKGGVKTIINLIKVREKVRSLREAMNNFI